MYEEDGVSDLEILQTQHHHRSVFSGVGILKIKNWKVQKERPNTGGRDYRDKYLVEEYSIPWPLKGHQANTQPSVVVWDLSVHLTRLHGEACFDHVKSSPYNGSLR